MWGETPFDQLACRIPFHRLRYQGRCTSPSVQGSLVYPGNFGVFNWGGIAVDPERQIAFAAPAQLAFVPRLVLRADDTTLYVQGENRPEESLPALNENFGAPFAVQLHAFTSILGVPCQMLRRRAMLAAGCPGDGARDGRADRFARTPTAEAIARQRGPFACDHRCVNRPRRRNRASRRPWRRAASRCRRSSASRAR